MGTLFGTTLVKSNHDVTFLDNWQPLIYAISQDPSAHLRFDSTVEKVPVKLLSSSECPSTDFDLIIIFVKSGANQSAMRTLSTRNVISDRTVILTLQGGIDSANTIAAHMPDCQLLLAGSTKSFCKSTGPMSIEKFGIATTLVWPHRCPKESEPLPRVREIVAVCAQSGLQIELTPQAITDRWKMVLSYPANNALSAITGLAYKQVCETDEGQNLLIDLAKEVAIIAKLDGIDETLFNETIAVETVREIARENPDRAGTMLIDLKACRTTEIDATAGALIRMGKKHGVKLPCMFTLWSILRIKEENYGNEYEI
jgi:2-dehydropantoate 2-reductase